MLVWLGMIYLSITHENVNIDIPLGKQHGKSLTAIPVFPDWELHTEDLF